MQEIKTKRRRIGFRYDAGIWDFISGNGLSRAMRFTDDLRADYKEFREIGIWLESAGTGYITIVNLSPERAETLVERIKKAFNNRVWEDQIF